MSLSWVEFDVSQGSVFSSDSFQNVAPLRAYLHQDQQENTEESNEEIPFFLAAVEAYDQLRFRAEECFELYQHRVESKRGALPLDWLYIADELLSDRDEPPRHLISEIAEKHLNVIVLLLQHMRKVLRRDRCMVPLARVQQFDSRCLTWFTRQPGRTAAEKAGSRQEMLAVVREETYNTLENRVLKAFLQRCVSEGIRYTRTYSRSYPESKRIVQVSRLVSMFSDELKGEAFRKISRLPADPTPNYVLLYDTHYSQIWRWYRQLLRKERLAESLWPRRHLFIQDYVKMVIAALMSTFSNYGFMPAFSSVLWFRYQPDQDGLMTDAPFYGNVYVRGEEILEFRELSSPQKWCWIWGGNKKRVRIMYIPYGKNVVSEYSEPAMKGLSEYWIVIGTARALKALPDKGCIMLVPFGGSLADDIDRYLRNWLGDGQCH